MEQVISNFGIITFSGVPKEAVTESFLELVPTGHM